MREYTECMGMLQIYGGGVDRAIIVKGWCCKAAPSLGAVNLDPPSERLLDQGDR